MQVLLVSLLLGAEPQPDEVTAGDLFTAVLLIQTPAEYPVNFPPERKNLRLAIAKKAVQWQIMDERETRYMLAKDEDMDADFAILRNRYEQLKDAPLIEEITWRLPNRNICNELIKFNRAFRKNLEERCQWELDRVPLFTVVIQETDTCYRHWDLIRDAQCEFYYVTVRRLAAKRYMDAMKKYEDEEGNYWDTGRTPPYVPFWRFTERR